jgi:hypothetical protein
MFKRIAPLVILIGLTASPAGAEYWVRCQKPGSLPDIFTSTSGKWPGLTRATRNRLVKHERTGRWVRAVNSAGDRFKCKISGTFGPSKPVTTDTASDTSTAKGKKAAPATRSFKPRARKSSQPRLPRNKASLRERMELYQPYIEEAAQKYTIPVAFIKGVIKVESNFSYRAVSKAGAQGLMQLMPGTARALGVKDSFDPRQNIMGGTLFLRQLANKYQGDMVKVLGAYNAGPGALAKRDGTVPYIGTDHYVRTVLDFYYQYKAELSP